MFNFYLHLKLLSLCNSIYIALYIRKCHKALNVKQTKQVFHHAKVSIFFIKQATNKYNSTLEKKLNIFVNHIQNLATLIKKLH